MGILDLFRRAPVGSAASVLPQADAQWGYSLADPVVRQAILGRGSESVSGEGVTASSAMANASVFRCVSLISSAIGMLPLHLIDRDTKENATEHPLFRLLFRQPNPWQTSFEFRKLMQRRALVKGNGYALVVRSRGQVQQLIPLDPDRITPFQNADWSLSYRYNRASGGPITLPGSDVFHLRGESDDGITGISLVMQAREAIGLALSADRAIGRVFKNGSFIDGVLQTDNKLSDEARVNLKASWSSRYAGADNAGKTPVLEEGLKYTVTGSTARDAQMHETRARQIEEVARVFGVPRPLLMVDDTSWGSGIDSLGQLFVQYGLNPWFEAWQQAINRSLLSDADQDRYGAKFNPGALERGSMEVQGAFFSAALGSGGHAPWMTPNEVRDLLDMSKHPDGDSLTNPMTAPQGANGAVDDPAS